jgi:hypothetical protein
MLSRSKQGRSRPSTPPGSPEKKKKSKRKSKETASLDDEVEVADLFGYCDLAESFRVPYKRHHAINVLLKSIFQTYSSAARSVVHLVTEPFIHALTIL